MAKHLRARKRQNTHWLSAPRGTNGPVGSTGDPPFRDVLVADQLVEFTGGPFTVGKAKPPLPPPVRAAQEKGTGEEQILERCDAAIWQPAHLQVVSKLLDGFALGVRRYRGELTRYHSFWLSAKSTTLGSALDHVRGVRVQVACCGVYERSFFFRPKADQHACMLTGGFADHQRGQTSAAR
ncbi:hypothetical protein [Hydrogenophaga sp.]|uniref:hypothetical protein n=1 Tax=Hydrogenophaga sp. TaxID=1904254 RepID=UPI00117B6DB2